MSTFFTPTQIKTASRALDEARRTFDCAAPRKDADGNESSESGVAYGTHGAAFVQIDPETLSVRCGACAGDLDATAAKKVMRGRHLVSL